MDLMPMESGHKKALEKMAYLRKTSKVAEKVFRKEEKEYSSRCWMARMVLNEALEEYEEGDMEWDAMVEDVTKTLKAMSKTEDSSLYEKDEDEDEEEED
jgi:hypothetical protein